MKRTKGDMLINFVIGNTPHFAEMRGLLKIKRHLLPTRMRSTIRCEDFSASQFAKITASKMCVCTWMPTHRTAMFPYVRMVKSDESRTLCPKWLSAALLLAWFLKRGLLSNQYSKIFRLNIRSAKSSRRHPDTVLRLLDLAELWTRPDHPYDPEKDVTEWQRLLKFHAHINKWVEHAKFRYEMRFSRNVSDSAVP